MSPSNSLGGSICVERRGRTARSRITWLKCRTSLLRPSAYVQLVALSESQQPIGFAEAAVRHDYINGTEFSPVAFLEGIYVVPEARRSGVASTFVSAVAANCWLSRVGL